MDPALDEAPAPPTAVPPRPPGNPWLFFLAVGVLYAGPGAAAQLSAPLPGLVWTQLFVFLLPAIAAAYAWNLDPARALRVDRPAPLRASLLALMIGLFGFLPAGAIMALVSLALPQGWVERFDLTPLFQGPPWERFALSASAALLAPLCEEIVFRGQLLSLLRARHGPLAAIAISAGLFALLHLDPIRFLPVFLLGLLFGWLAWRAGSLWPAVAAHAANNAIASTFVAAGRPPPEAQATPEPAAAAGAAVFGLLLLVPLLVSYARLTPQPPPAHAALELLDPADDAAGFRLRRIPRGLYQSAMAGALVLALLAGWKLARGGG